MSAKYVYKIVATYGGHPAGVIGYASTRDRAEALQRESRMGSYVSRESVTATFDRVVRAIEGDGKMAEAHLVSARLHDLQEGRD